MSTNLSTWTEDTGTPHPLWNGAAAKFVGLERELRFLVLLFRTETPPFFDSNDPAVRIAKPNKTDEARDAKRNFKDSEKPRMTRQVSFPSEWQKPRIYRKDQRWLQLPDRGRRRYLLQSSSAREESKEER